MLRAEHSGSRFGNNAKCWVDAPTRKIPCWVANNGAGSEPGHEDDIRMGTGSHLVKNSGRPEFDICNLDTGCVLGKPCVHGRHIDTEWGSRKPWLHGCHFAL